LTVRPSPRWRPVGLRVRSRARQLIHACINGLHDAIPVCEHRAQREHCPEIGDESRCQDQHSQLNKRRRARNTDSRLCVRPAAGGRRRARRTGQGRTSRLSHHARPAQPYGNRRSARSQRQEGTRWDLPFVRLSIACCPRSRTELNASPAKSDNAVAIRLAPNVSCSSQLDERARASNEPCAD
jgi:hypothetical protein